MAMKTEADATVNPEASETKPYAMLGAGRLAAAIWKSGDTERGWRYRFNIFRMSKSSGRVSQRFTPRDLPDLARLVKLAASVISEDGGLSREYSDDLSCFAACLDMVLPSNPRERTVKPERTRHDGSEAGD